MKKTTLLLCIIFTINYTNYAQKLVNSIDDLPKLVDSIYAHKFIGKPVGFLLSEVYYNFNVIIPAIAPPDNFIFIIGNNIKDPHFSIDVEPEFLDNIRFKSKFIKQEGVYNRRLNEIQSQALKEDGIVRCIRVSIPSKKFYTWYGNCGFFN